MNLPTGSKSFARLNPHLFQVRSAECGVLNNENSSERDLHDKIEAYCRARGFAFVHSRMDQASTIAVGFPDFAIFMPGGKTVFIECKRPGGKATPPQMGTLAHLRRLGFVAEIATSMTEVLQAMESAACNPS